MSLGVNAVVHHRASLREVQGLEGGPGERESWSLASSEKRLHLARLTILHKSLKTVPYRNPLWCRRREMGPPLPLDLPPLLDRWSRRGRRRGRGRALRNCPLPRHQSRLGRGRRGRVAWLLLRTRPRLLRARSPLAMPRTSPNQVVHLLIGKTLVGKPQELHTL